jgi:hypothetical protein
MKPIEDERRLYGLYMAVNLALVQAQNARLRLCVSAIGELISMLDYYLRTLLSEFSLMNILG